MLSSEPDLPCSCETSQIKSSYENNQHQLDDEIDLFKSGIDDNNVYPLPNFSMRDYVFSTRGKDIKKNWPFSSKNLQLCLKYGLNDVLPPFQSPDSVGNPSTAKCAAENLSYRDGKLSARQKLTVDNENINSCGSEKDKEFPSTTKGQACSGTISVHSLENPTETPEFTVKSSKKFERNIQNAVKKCRMIVKSKNIAEQKSNPDLIFNPPLISETMASKICPVCKTFSSSSNTTLNAHIDQCLSGESNIKWTANPKQAIKYRIKPRKTRLMSDIYETALHSTLEDLDRRNGTNWTSNNLVFQADQDSETCAVDKNKPCSLINFEDVNGDGDVYIDSNGTKLRILSKLADVPSSSNGSYDCGPGKLLKREKGDKFLSCEKKKYPVQKEKLLDHCLYGQGSDSPGPDRVPKCSPHGWKNCDSWPDHRPEPEVNHGQQNKFEVCDDVRQSHVAYDQMKSDDLGMIKQWVGSKRTGLRGKINLEHESYHLPDKRKKYTKIKSGVSERGTNMLVKRNSGSKSHISSDEIPLSHKESHKRKRNSLCNSPCDECIEQQPSSRKRPGISLFKAQGCRDKNNHLEVSKFVVKHSRNDSSSNSVENHDSLRNDSSFIGSRMSQHHTFSSEGKEYSYPKKISSGDVIPSGSKKFLSLRKKLLSVKHAFGRESETELREKHLNFKKRRLGENEARTEKKDSSKSLINKSRVLKFQKREGYVNAAKGDVSLKGLEMSPKSDNLETFRKNIDYFTGGNEIQDEFVCQPKHAMADGQAFVAFSKSFDSASHGPAGPNVEFVSQHYGELETFCTNEDSVLNHNSHDVAEMDEAQRSYYVDVDPIPIPGPPGSFLPSPGRMGSIERHGNSSLTTCRIQSSEDEREFVGLDSSDSPLSAMSAVTNPFAPRSKSPSIVNLTIPSHVRQKFPEKKSDPEYCVSPTPTSNPVLRLMGKNLMVVNKDENRSSQTRLSTQSSMSIESNPGPWLCVDNGISTCNNIHNEPHSFSRILSGGPPVLENMQTSIPAQHFDCNLYEYGYKVPADFRPLQMQAHPSIDMLLAKSSSMSHEYGSKRKDIIVIDDSPEISEAGLDIRATYNGVNPFYGYPLCAGSPIFQNGNYSQVPFSKGKWINCTDEGSSMLGPIAPSASLPSVVHYRSSLYFSPGFS